MLHSISSDTIGFLLLLAAYCPNLFHVLSACQNAVTTGFSATNWFRGSSACFAKKTVLILKIVLPKSQIKFRLKSKRGLQLYIIITCSNCDVQYIGETGRYLQPRRRDNERSVRDNKMEHVQQTGHARSWENMQPVIKENRWCRRRWKEACMIFKKRKL